MNTKHIIPLLLSATLTLACSDDVAPYGEKIAGEQSLTVDNSSVNFDNSKSQTVSIKASQNLAWQITSANSWFTIDKNSGTGPAVITITATGDNPQENTRTSTITIEAPRYNLTATINVSQAGSYIRVTEELLEFNALSEEKTITVESNAEWTIRDNWLSWLDVSPTEGPAGRTSVKLTSHNNPDSAPNEGTLSFYSTKSQATKSITVRRKGVELKIADGFNPVFERDDTTPHELIITSNYEWAITGVPSWLTLSSQSGKMTSTVSLKASANNGSQRTATLYVTAGNVTQTVEVTQKGKGAPGVDDNPTPRTSRNIQ